MTSSVEQHMDNEAFSRGNPPPRSNRIDQHLVDAIRAGDIKARNALAHRAGDAAYVFALQMTRDADTAHDIAQDSVLSFFKHLDRFDATRPIEPWLYQIVRNRVRDLSRRTKIRAHESLDMWLEHGREKPDPTANPAADAERRELQRTVWAAISTLSESHREIIALRDYHDLSYKELAAVLDIPHGTVMSRLHAARQRLRQIMTEDGLNEQGVGT